MARVNIPLRVKTSKCWTNIALKRNTKKRLYICRPNGVCCCSPWHAMSLRLLCAISHLAPMNRNFR